MGAMMRRLNERERKDRNRVTTEGKAQERKEMKRVMHENASTCYVQK